MSEYEIAVLFDPGLEVDLDKGTKKVEKIIAESGGKVTKTDNWGKKKLAYPIKKQEHAIYVFYTVKMEPAGVQKIEGALNITDEVIRYLIVRPDFKAIARAEAAKAKKAKRAKEDEAEEE